MKEDTKICPNCGKVVPEKSLIHKGDRYCCPECYRRITRELYGGIKHDQC